ncbi:hypothetical protein STSP2_03142 [Anaerohalosphaera lusitana]|uniref:Uncharacterized protein n=1 Tax=Anaerohalosphaera lusitana TaxID=1936003 RepID=A0A1U9NPS9_9BACT|nr:hypothetical protein [Anaerohalosphaera lusitana]AQT69942.1 hypothetical protein STSP2_03142 [Anaerohalosphaera lusitana]
MAGKKATGKRSGTKTAAKKNGGAAKASAKAKTAKPKTKKRSGRRSRIKKVWRVYRFGPRYELADDIRICRESPLKFTKDFVGSGTDDESVGYAQQMVMLKNLPNWLTLRGAFAELKNIAANQSRLYRGYLLFQFEPAQPRHIAMMLGIDEERAKVILEALESVGLLEKVAMPEFVEDDEGDPPPGGDDGDGGDRRGGKGKGTKKGTADRGKNSGTMQDGAASGNHSRTNAGTREPLKDGQDTIGTSAGVQDKSDDLRSQGTIAQHNGTSAESNEAELKNVNETEKSLTSLGGCASERSARTEPGADGPLNAGASAENGDLGGDFRTRGRGTEFRSVPEQPGTLGNARENPLEGEGECKTSAFGLGREEKGEKETAAAAPPPEVQAEVKGKAEQRAAAAPVPAGKAEMPAEGKVQAEAERTLSGRTGAVKGERQEPKGMGEYTDERGEVNAGGQRGTDESPCTTPAATPPIEPNEPTRADVSGALPSEGGRPGASHDRGDEDEEARLRMCGARIGMRGRYGREALEFAGEIYELLSLPYDPRSETGKRELGAFAAAWQRATLAGLGEVELGKLRDKSVKEAKKIRRVGRSRKPGAVWLSVFGKRLNAMVGGARAAAG